MIKTFGEPQTFAIRYRPYNDSEISKDDRIAFCHLIIDNKLIGFDDEFCCLPTWVYNLTESISVIEQNKNNFFPKEFDNLSDREIFEVLLKSSQLVEEFFEEFLYLPQLDNNAFCRHQFILDETIDGHYFYYYVKNNRITFLIEDLKGLGHEVKRSNKFIFSSVDIDKFFETINNAVAFLVRTYPYLKDSISTRIFNSR